MAPNHPQIGSCVSRISGEPLSPDMLSLTLLQELERGAWKSSHWGQALEEFVCPAHKEAKGALTVGGSVLSCCLQSASMVAMKETLLAGELLEV